MQDEQQPRDRAALVFSTWMKMPNVVGCHFAPWAASSTKLSSGVFFEPPDAELIESLNAQIELSAEKKQFFLALFPHILTGHAIEGLLTTMAENSRWSVRRSTVQDIDSIELYWRTPGGPLASVIGFGPFPTMPLTRRAPLVGLGLWGGGHENPRRSRVDPNVVGIGDMAHGLKDPDYDSRLAKTKEVMRELKAAGLQDNFPPAMTFRLPVT